MDVEKGTRSPFYQGGSPLYVFLNGDIVVEEEAVVSIRDRGFLYGDGLFESLRSYQGRPFLLKDHLDRLAASAHALDIPLNYTKEVIEQAVKKLLELNKLKDAYIRITLSRGEGGAGLLPEGANNPNLFIETRTLLPYSEELYEKGMRLIISDYRRSTTCPLARHKTANFLTGVLARQEAKNKGSQDAILLNTDGYVCETTVSNIFMVEGNQVLTPPLEANILPGITRKTVLDICKKEGIPARQELFGPERFLEAQEIFLTNSLMEIMPVAGVQNQGIGKVGRITRQLMESYKERTQITPGQNI